MVSYEERSLLKDVEEMVEVYYNSGQFMHTLEYLLAGREDTFFVLFAIIPVLPTEGVDGI